MLVFLSGYLLVLQVDWDDEKVCFQTIAAALGNFYALHPPLLPNPSGDGLQFYKGVTCSSPEEGQASKDAGMTVTECSSLVNLVQLFQFG